MIGKRRVIWLSGLLAALMALSALAIVPGILANMPPIAEDATDLGDVSTSGDVTATEATNPSAMEDTFTTALWKLDPELRQAALAGGKGWTQVDILTVRNAELAPVLNSYGARSMLDTSLEGRNVGAISFRSSGDGTPVVQRLWVPEVALAEISSLPGVLSVSKPLRPELHVATGPDLSALEGLDVHQAVSALQEKGIELDNWPSIIEHESKVIHDSYGITGDGVNIAIVDTPVDFGQPNLIGRWATVTNASSPYFGWPIVFDSGTILFNLELWSVADDFDRYPYPFFSTYGTSGDSFYSDTHYTIGVNATGYLRYALYVGGLTKRADPTGVSGVVNLSLIVRDYYVGNATDPNRIESQSGEYRLGILKDNYLTELYGERVGLLVVDSQTAGVYDTVYADLDFDNDFTDENPANQSQPLLYRDFDNDTLPDLSGGLVYFIAQSTDVTGEVVIPSAVGDETWALLANGNLAADMIPPFVDLGMPILYLNGSYWPSSGDDIYEFLFTSTGEEKGTTTSLTSGVTLHDFFTAVDTASLLANYSLGSIYDFSSSIEGALVDGVDYEIDMDTGDITWLRPLEPGADIEIIYTFDTWTVDFATGNITFDAPPTLGSVVTADYGTGLPVPASDILAERHGLDLFVPANGDLVALYGEYLNNPNIPSSHGTSTASTAAGASTSLMAGGLFDTYGQAPGANIISVDFFKTGTSLTDVWAFAVEGINGYPGDPDDAMISSNSWGWVNNPEGGWEFASRWQQYLTDTTGVIFVQSSGNEGPGYATMGGPASKAGVMAGAGRSSDIWWLLGVAGGEQYTWPIGTGPLGPGPYGDVSHFSSRGPTAVGQPGVDVLGIGDSGIAGVPVNIYLNGADSWDLFAGTSMAAPNVAGILALMIEAYNNTHVGYPSPTLLQSVLKTTANDVHQDVLSQGAGLANARRAVTAIMESEGVVADVDEWVPGDYNGVSRDMFLNFLEPGESDTVDITLTNYWGSPVSVALSDEVYQRTGTFSFTWILNNTGAGDFFFGRPDWWILNKTGVWRTNDTNFPGFGQEATADLSPYWDTADFMKVFTYSDPTIGAHTPALFLRDWNDTNGNGTWDGPGTEDSLIAPVYFFGQLTEHRQNSQWVYSPGTRIHDGLGVGHGALAGSSDGTPTPVTMYVEFYERTDWNWLSLNVTNLNLAADESGSVTATVDVPADAAPGSYQGAIYYNDGVNTTTIPVLVNVPATELPLNFGDATVQGTLYEPNTFNPAQMGADDGDGRWFWLDTTAVAASNRKLLYNLNWGNISSDAEIYTFHAIPDPDWTDDAVFGPSTFELLDVTKRDASVTDTVEPYWEFLASDVLEGLFFVKVQGLRSTEPAESMGGNVGIMTVNTDDVRISTTELAGSFPITLSANVPLRSAVQPDPANPTVAQTKDVVTEWTDLPITPYAYTGGPFVDYLYNSTDTTETDVPADAESATWTVAFGSDVDVGIFYDDDCDGTYTAADVVGMATSGVNNPEIISLVAPAEGCYWVHAAGFDVGPTETYDLTQSVEIPVVAGLGTAVTEAVTELYEDLPVDPYPYPGGDFVTYLFGAPNKFVTVVPVGTIAASWSIFFHSGANDVDAGLFYDDDCDGVYTVADDAIGTVMATGANPESASLTFPPPGCYWVHAAGYDVAPGSLYDLTFQINKIGVSAFAPANTPEATVPADQPSGFDLTWDFEELAEGVTSGILFVSPGNAPFALAQLVSITLKYDLTPPTFSDFLPAPSAIVADSTPGIFVQVNDPTLGAIVGTGEIDEASIRVWLDGVEITNLAEISVPHVTNQGYPTGAVLYTPPQPLAEGSHTVRVDAGDFAGNVGSTTWSFIVNAFAPSLVITSPVTGLVTSASSVIVSGITEPGASVTVADQAVSVGAAGSFSTSVSLSEGANAIEVASTDAQDNVARTTVTVMRDTAAPAISQVLSSEGLLTSSGLTVIRGMVNEPASLTVGGAQATVRADGSFEAPVRLLEGGNAVSIVATDAAGNQGTASLTVVRDTTPPTLTLNALPSETSGATVTVSGTVESGIGFVTVNGQPVGVTNGQYSTEVALSFGSNEVFVEATDGAGNVNSRSAAVSYVPTGVSVSSVGLMLLPVLAVIGLLVGLFLGQRVRGGPPKTPPKTEAIRPPTRTEQPPTRPEGPQEGGP